MTRPRSGTGASESRKRADGRRALLTYLRPDLIKNLKKAALDDERNAYEIVEELVEKWLESRKSRKPRGERTEP